MDRIEKAGYRLTHGSGSNEKWLTVNQRNPFGSDCKVFPVPIQCQHCRSDYMSFSVGGNCQRCQQRAEVVIRESPATIRGALKKGVSQ